MPLRPFRVVDVVGCKDCSVDRPLGGVCAFRWKNVCAAGSKAILAQGKSLGAPCNRQRRGCARRAPEPLSARHVSRTGGLRYVDLTGSRKPHPQELKKRQLLEQ